MVLKFPISLLVVMAFVESGGRVMQIPFLDLQTQYQQLAEQLEHRVLHVLRSGQYILGPEVEAFENRAAQYLGIADAIAVSSGTDALLMALMGLGIGPGDEVLVPDFSFVATAMVVVRVGATPVFVDVEPNTLTIDVQQAAAKVTNRTRAIIPVHLYGQMADMDAVLQLAREHDLWVIEDAAQAFGAEHRSGKKAGTLGTVGCFSFYPTKNLGAAGEAGLIVTNDPALAARLRIIRNQGQQHRYNSTVIGGNFRMDAVQAAILNVKLPMVDQWNQHRQQLAHTYRHLLEQMGLLEQPHHPIRLLNVRYADSQAVFPHVYHQFVVLAHRRDALRQFLAQQGIETQVYYPVPFHRQQCFARYPSIADPFPVAETAAQQVLALPIYPGLPLAAQQAIVQAMKHFYDA